MNKSKVKPKLLFVVPLYFANLPRNIRAQNLIKHLADTHECHVLCFDIPIAYDIGAKAYIHKIRFSSFSKYIHQRRHFPSLKVLKPLLFVFRGLNYFLMNYILFPDNLVIEVRRILRALRALDAKHKFDKIILSVIPFSLLAVLRDRRIRGRTISDIGDPLLQKKVLRSSKTYEERFLPLAYKVVVTNENTRDYYANGRGIPADKVFVVRQGYDDEIFYNERLSSDFDFRELNLILSGAFYGEGWRDPNPLLKAATAFKECAPISMTYYGSSINVDQVNENVVRVFPKVDQSKLSEAYRQHNMLVFVDNDNMLQTPGKIFEMLAMKIPILYLYTIETETKVMLDGVDGIFFVKNEYQEILDFFHGVISKNYSFRFCDWSNSANWARRAKEFGEILND